MKDPLMLIGRRTADHRLDRPSVQAGTDERTRKHNYNIYVYNEADIQAYIQADSETSEGTGITQILLGRCSLNEI